MSTYNEYWPQRSVSESGSLKWFSASALLHAGLAVAVVTMNFALNQEIEKPPVIEVELLSSGKAQMLQAPAPMVIPEPKAEIIKSTAQPEIAAAAPPSVQAKTESKAAPKKAFPKAESIRLVKSPAHRKVLPLAKVTSKAGGKSAPKVLVTDDESAPELVTSDLENSINSTSFDAPRNLDDKDLDKNLKDVEVENEKALLHEKAEIDKSLNEEMSAHGQQIAALEEENKRQDDLMAQSLNQQKSENQKAISALAAQAKANQVAAGEREAAQRAAENAKAGALKAALARGAGFGMDSPVRALEDLRQFPGNPKPHYTREDRLAGRYGVVTLVAFISKQGRPVEFKLIQSTGHRTLDLQTLKSVKEWRFYPGQEGWVEIPFKWDLKGGAQEMPATLRRS